MPLTPPNRVTLKTPSFDSIHSFRQLKPNTYTFLPRLITNMIIKKETPNTTRLQHPSSPSKSSSLSFKKHQEFHIDSAPSTSPRMIRRSDSMILQKPLVHKKSIHEKVMIRRRRASKEIVKRALTPPARRLDWRWFNFRPTPSRLSVMSMAI